MVHLVYCDNANKRGDREIDKIISGNKTMVIRGAAGRKIPHSRVFSGDTLYFMEKATAQISVSAQVINVYNFIKLTDEEIISTLNKFDSKLKLSEKQKERWHKKCLCLVEFDTVHKIEFPLDFDHQGNMDDWLIIEKIEDVVVGSCIPYNYTKSRF